MMTIISILCAVPSVIPYRGEDALCYVQRFAINIELREKDLFDTGNTTTLTY